jgi:hypothetical protein
VSQRRLDRAADVAAVAVKRRLLGLVRAEPRLEGCAERCAGADVALLVDLSHQSSTDALGFTLVSRRVGQVEPLAGDRILPGVDHDLVGAAPLTDGPALSLRSRSGHDRSLLAVRDLPAASPSRRSRWSNRMGPRGIEPRTRGLKVPGATAPRLHAAAQRSAVAVLAVLVGMSTGTFAVIAAVMPMIFMPAAAQSCDRGLKHRCCRRHIARQ